MPSTSSETQTACGVTAIPFGAAPTGNVPVTAFFAGSMRDTVPSRLFATQTLPSPYAIADGPLPTSILRRRRR